MPIYPGIPTGSARAYGAQYQDQGARLNQGNVQLRLARMDQIKAKEERLWAALRGIRQHREAKKAAEKANDKGALGGFGSAGGAGVGAGIGFMVGGPVGGLIGAGIGSSVGGGIDQATRGDTAGAVSSFTNAATQGVRLQDRYNAMIQQQNANRIDEYLDDSASSDGGSSDGGSSDGGIGSDWWKSGD